MRVLLFLACATPTPTPAPEPAPAVPASVEPVVPEPPAPAPAPIDLTVPKDANLLATRLADAERQIRDPAVADAVAAELGHLAQRIYRALADDPVLAGAVLAKLPDELREAATRNVEGTRAIARTVPRPKTDLPAWRIVAPAPVAELEGYYREAEAKHGVPWSILAAIHLVETKMGRLRGTSDAGAQGPMQFMPATWKAYGEGDVNDTRDAILGAGNYLAKMGWKKNPDKAIWHYNHHDAYVAAVKLFAANLDADPKALRGYWGWQVYYRTVVGAIWLAEGYEQHERVPIEVYCGTRGEPFCPDLQHPR